LTILQKFAQTHTPCAFLHINPSPLAVSPSYLDERDASIKGQ
jgi:hypothetical protein